MPYDKDRLYLALFPREREGKVSEWEDNYDWGLILGPKYEDKKSNGTFFFAGSCLNEQHEWVRSVEVVHQKILAPSNLLVRVIIGKILNRDRLESIISGTQVRPETTGPSNVFWVQDVLKNLENDSTALGRRVLQWEIVRDATFKLYQHKIKRQNIDIQTSKILPYTRDLVFENLREEYETRQREKAAARASSKRTGGNKRSHGKVSTSGGIFSGIVGSGGHTGGGGM